MTTKKRIPTQRPINANRSTSNKRPTNGAKAKAKPSAAAPAHPTKSPGESAVSASAGAPPSTPQAPAPGTGATPDAATLVRAILGAFDAVTAAALLAATVSYVRSLAALVGGKMDAADLDALTWHAAHRFMAGDRVWLDPAANALLGAVFGFGVADLARLAGERSIGDLDLNNGADMLVAVGRQLAVDAAPTSDNATASESRPIPSVIVPVADMPDGVHAIASGDRLFVRDAPRETRPSAPQAARKPAEVLRDAARALHAEGATLADDGPRAEIASALVSLAAGKLSWREVVNAAGACGRLAGEAADKADRYREAEHTSHLVYPLATARALARCSVDLFDALDARFSLPDGLAGIAPDADGLAGEDIDGAAYVEIEAPLTASA